MAVICVKVTSSVALTWQSRCSHSGMSRSSNLAPGGMQTAQTAFAGLDVKYVFKADHQPSLLAACSSVVGAAISAADARPFVPVGNQWTTNDSTSNASRFGTLISE